jgi:hypothetical protein
MKTFKLTLVYLLLVVTPVVAAQKTTKAINVLAWNVESEGNDPRAIAAQLGKLKGYDIYCLCEVHSKSLGIYKQAMPKGFESVNSVTGFEDRLQILFNAKRFKMLEQKEVHEMNDRERKHRSPLALRLRDLRSKKEFIVMVNHLARGSEEVRNEQARKMREWARGQSVGIINVGDFNYDYSFRRQRGNAAFAEMLQDNVWQWVKPKKLVDTNWADKDGDGMDNYPDSMLDFAFVAGPAKKWNAECRVIVRKGDFPDGPRNSDHRPIELRIVPQ